MMDRLMDNQYKYSNQWSKLAFKPVSLGYWEADR